MPFSHAFHTVYTVRATGCGNGCPNQTCLIFGNRCRNGCLVYSELAIVAAIVAAIMQIRSIDNLNNDIINNDVNKCLRFENGARL